MIPGVPEPLDACRKPELLTDAAQRILTRDARQATDNSSIDDELLAAGITDLSRYAVKPGTALLPDIFIN
jgi:citronellol/citronellal dehydrogenase